MFFACLCPTVEVWLADYSTAAFQLLRSSYHLSFACSVDECLLRLKTRLSSTKSSWPVSKDLLDFNGRYERLMSWLIQKEKMASLLVPVGCELPVLSNQLLQTRVTVHCSVCMLMFATFSPNSSALEVFFLPPLSKSWRILFSVFC